MDARERIVLVTGATDGIGKQTAVEIARRGARVIAHGRSREKADRAAEAIAKAAGVPTVDACAGDFASLASVRALGEDVRARYPRLDVLINNAGVIMDARALTGDGFEMTFQVNHLASFLLTLMLLPSLKASEQGRVVHVSSMAHASGRLDFDDLDAKKRFDGYTAYATSKLCNVLFAYELARRLEGSPVTSNALHPGVITTKLLWKGFGSKGASLERGAATSVKVALDASLASTTGRYFDDEREARSSTASRDLDTQRRLWDVSLERTAAPWP